MFGRRTKKEEEEDEEVDDGNMRRREGETRESLTRNRPHDLADGNP